ncbi:MAG: ABC transporter permease [Planctomycetales bacterium]|nr:ABC transporter permease [Planctomycetales bacterium]
MLAYALRRCLLAVGTLLGITIVTFLIISVAPGDPAAIHSEDPKLSARVYEQLRKHFELDRPLPERYARWLSRGVRGDFGVSFADGRPVMGKIAERIPATATLAILSILLGLTCAIPIGIGSAANRNGWFDTTSGVSLYLLYSVPSYVAGMVLIHLVGVKLDLLPFRGMTSDGFDSLSLIGKAFDIAKHLALILFCYTFHSVAYDSRFIRQNLLEVLRQDFVRTARAKGVREARVVWRHAFPNTMIPVLTRLGLLVPAILSGSVILEVMFSWPGIGRLYFDAVLMRDYPLVMAETVLTAALVLLGTLLADLAYAWADPRIAYA